MKKYNDNKKIQIFLSVVALLAVSFSYQYFDKVQTKEMKKVKSTAKIEKKIIKNQIHPTKEKAKKPSRKIASVPSSSVINKIQDRKIVGLSRIDKDFPITNSINKDWKTLAIKKLSHSIEDGTKIEIQLVKPALYVKHNIGRYVEHVKISFKKPSGLKSGYDAYIDSQTGHVVQTWNQTQFEIVPKYTLKSHGNEFIGVPLKKQPKTSL